MTEMDLNTIHKKMIKIIELNFGKIDKIYFCPDINDSSIDRKPNIGMALKAKNEFPLIDFKKSVMIGDSSSDILFGHRLGMQTVFINALKRQNNNFQFEFKSLIDFTNFLIESLNKKLKK